MRYIGSKSATLPWLAHVISERAPSATSICDPFAGTCTVARHFKGLGMRVVTGDVLKLSHVLQVACIGHDAPPPFVCLTKAGVVARRSSVPAVDVLTHLQSLPGVHGYVSEEFSPAGPSRRLFFTQANAGLIDAIRMRLGEWQAADLLTENETAFLRATLICAADRVANTAGTYYAHLKQLSRKPRKAIQLSLPLTTFEGSSGGCHNADAVDVVSAVETDILYLDPPYNQRDYAGYYHLPETLARGDAPLARGRSGAPAARVARSDFYRSTRAADALARIVAKARARHIVVHYTTEGMIPHEAIMEMLRARGDVQSEDRPVRAYSAVSDAGRREVRHRLYWCDVASGAV